MDSKILKTYGWTDWLTSLKTVHNPKSLEEMLPTSLHRQRLIFDELMANQIAVRLAREERNKALTGKALKFSGELVLNLLSNVHFTLTHGQKTVLKEICEAQRSSKMMVRVLQGDVGSGKTIVALCAMMNAVEAGKQAAIMAPTDLLANQHFHSISVLLGGLAVRIELLTGKTKKSKRQNILNDLLKGETNILVGTHALFQDKVNFRDLGLVVIDEQHRFGVQQRMSLIKKGIETDVLAMSATPIPRTLSLAIYGDMDVSIIKDKPAGRTPIETYVVSDTKN